MHCTVTKAWLNFCLLHPYSIGLIKFLRVAY
nr:MAG TPA: hypothetical protein [Caudoviricetes sp.]